MGRDEFQRAHEDDNKMAAAEHPNVQGNAVIIDEQAQKQAGIAVEALTPASYAASQKWMGVVLDLRPLIEARQKFISLSAQLASAQAQVQQKRNELTRTQGLYDEGRNASKRELEAARAALASQEQAEIALQAELHAVVDGVRLQWGQALADKLADKDGLVSRAINRQLEVVQFAVPEGSVAKNQQWRVDVSATGQSNGIAATLIGRASQSTPGMPGESWLLAMPPSGVASGSRVRVISPQGKPQKGVLVPTSAVIRFAGKSWVYVQTAEDRFERMPLPVDRAMGEGFFTDTLERDASIVTSGAQLLLSEEFRFQIKNENKD